MRSDDDGDDDERDGDRYDKDDSHCVDVNDDDDDNDDDGGGDNRELKRFHFDRFSLTNFICSCGRGKLASFSLTSLLVEKLAQGDLARINLTYFSVHANK